MSKVEIFLNNTEKLLKHYSVTNDDRLEYLQKIYNEQSIEHYKQVVSHERLDVNSKIYKDSRTTSFVKLVDLYTETEQYLKAIVLCKEQEECLKIMCIENNALKLGILMLKSSLYLKIEEYQKASDGFSELFEEISFDSSIDIWKVLPPYLDWYQCKGHLDNLSSESKIDSFSEKFINFLKNKYGDEYSVSIEKSYVGLKALAESKSDPMFTQQRAEAFGNIFMDGSNLSNLRD